MSGILRSNGASVPLLLPIFAGIVAKVLGNACNEAGFYCYNCTAVQICVGGVPMGDPIMCPEGYTCDSYSQIECIYGPCRYPTTTPTTDTPEPFVCWAKGRFADPFNSNKYYICLSNYLQPGQFTMLEAICPYGSTFSDEVKRCEYLHSYSIPTRLDEQVSSNTADISRFSPETDEPGSGTSIDDTYVTNFPTETNDSSDDSETIVTGKPSFSDNPTSFKSTNRSIVSNTEEYVTSKNSWEISTSSVENSYESSDIATDSPADKSTSGAYVSSPQTDDLVSNAVTEDSENTETSYSRFTSVVNVDDSTTAEPTVNDVITDTPKTSAEFSSETTDAESGSEGKSTFADSSAVTSSVYFASSDFPDIISTTSKNMTKSHKRTTEKVKTSTEDKHHHHHEHKRRTTTATPNVYCPSPGVYPDIWNCSKYYYCRYHKGNLIIYKRRCSKKKYFSIKYKKCVKKRYSECY